MLPRRDHDVLFKNVSPCFFLRIHFANASLSNTPPGVENSALVDKNQTLPTTRVLKQLVVKIVL